MQHVFSCTIACGCISTIDKEYFKVENKPQYWSNSGGLEYEAAWAMGADTGVDDIDAITYTNFLCNEYGFDPISFGATVAAGWSYLRLARLPQNKPMGWN